MAASNWNHYCVSDRSCFQQNQSINKWYECFKKNLANLLTISLQTKSSSFLSKQNPFILNLTFCFINSDHKKKFIFSFWLQFKCFLYVCIFTNLNKHRKINGGYWWPTFYIVHYILLSKSYSLFVQNHFQRQRTLIRSVTKLSLWTPLKDRLTLFIDFD